jgi:hypothetical protein
MKSTRFPAVKEWCFSDTVLPDSIGEMAEDGFSGNEGVVLWLGHRHRGKAEVTHLVALQGSGVTKLPDFLHIDASLLNDVTDIAIDLGVCLIGQIHSHGQLHGTSLSFTDITCGIAVPFYLSVVAPDYALRPATAWKDCGVHVFESVTGYRRFSPAEIGRRIHVVSGNRPPMLRVGEGK